MSISSTPIILSIIFGAVFGIILIVLFVKITSSGKYIRRTFSKNRFIFFIILLFLALPIPHMLSGLLDSKFKQIMLTAGISTVLVFFLIFSFLARCFYCSDCGQCLGTRGNVCPRCGCNIYTDDFSGTGATIREGRKNY